MYYICVRERLVAYGIILFIFYIGLYMWNQKERELLLNDQVIDFKTVLEKQRILIDAQEEYINYLEIQLQPIYKREIPKYNQPI